MSDKDRTTHGLTPYGGRIVRCEPAGKWYIEDSLGQVPISVDQAAILAALGIAYLDKPGGEAFDAAVRIRLETA